MEKKPIMYFPFWVVFVVSSESEFRILNSKFGDGVEDEGVEDKKE